MAWRNFYNSDGGFPDKTTYTNKEVVKKVIECMHKGIKMRKRQ